MAEGKDGGNRHGGKWQRGTRTANGRGARRWLMAEEQDGGKWWKSKMAAGFGNKNCDESLP